jgi:hypothetical protein
MDLKEINDKAYEITRISKAIPETQNQLETIEDEIKDLGNVSIKIEDGNYLYFPKEAVVLFLTDQLKGLELKLKELGDQLNNLIHF